MFVSLDKLRKDYKKNLQSLMITSFYYSSIYSIIPNLKSQASEAIGEFFYLND